MSNYSLGTISINQQTKRYIDQILKTKRLSYGKFCQEFEKKIAQLHDCQYGIVCSSGTAALHNILAALKIQYHWIDSDEIIVPAVTFVATVNAILLAGLKPVLVDVDPLTYNLNPDLIEKKITAKTKAILPVHLFGQPADMKPIMALAKKHDLLVVEDCCETMAATVYKRKVGSFGIASAFSTNSAHVLATGIGGVITTNNQKLATLMQSLINHGRDSAYFCIDDDVDVNDTKFETIINNRFLFNYPGFSYRLSEFEGAVGLAQLENLDQLIKARIKNAQYLNKNLASLKKYLQLPQILNDHNVFMAYPLVLTPSYLNSKTHSLAKLIQFLESHEIETRPLMPVLGQPAYRKLKLIKKDYPVAKYLAKAGFYVGCHQDLTKQDLDFFIKKLNEFFST